VDTYDTNALRVFIDSTLQGLDGCSLDEPEDREVVAEVLVEVLTEYFGSPKLVIVHTRSK
jgi:hypothetical protein